MSTLDDLIASIHTSLHSYTGAHEQVTYLTTACADDDLTLTVGSSDSVNRGVVEIEDELVYVDTADSNGLLLPPFGRGYKGTTAAAHPINSQVTFDPFFPRAEIRRAIDQTIEGLYPTLYQIKSETFTFTPPSGTFELDATADGVISVHEEADPSFDYWQPLARWSFYPNSAVASGKALNLFDPVAPGANVKVTYRAKFGTFEDGSDTLTSIGLSESYADLILYGVTSRMIRFLDATRLQVKAVENLSRAGVVQTGDAGKIANQLYAMYQQRLTEERSRLLELNPPSINFTR